MRSDRSLPGRILGLFDGSMAAERNDDMKMHVRQRAPIELHRRPRRIHFHRRAVRRGERIEFVVLVIDWFRIVGLKRRTSPGRSRSQAVSPGTKAQDAAFIE